MRTPGIVVLFWLAMMVGNVSGAPDSAGSVGRGATPSNADVSNRTITLELRVPDGAWEVSIQEIRRVKDELWVFARVVRPAGALGAMMICTASDSVTARLPDLPLRTFVIGKTWEWKNTEAVEWISESSDIYRSRWRTGERLWQRPRP